MTLLQATKLFFIQGGFFMWGILAASVFGLAIILERFYKIGFQFRINAKDFMHKIFTFLENDQIEQATQLCEKSKTPLSSIIKSGLSIKHADKSVIQNTIDEVMLEQLPRVSQRIEYLNMIANISTLQGLLGTIMGLIHAFHAVGQADAVQKATVLAEGIAMALNTTAFGLMVAIPCMISYSILNSMADRIIDDIEESSLKFMNRYFP